MPTYAAPPSPSFSIPTYRDANGNLVRGYPPSPYFTPSPSTLLPRPVGPGSMPVLRAAPELGTHTAGACGCGGSHSGAPATTPGGGVSPATGPPLSGNGSAPSFLSTSMALDTPPAPTTGGAMQTLQTYIDSIDWQRDWWKFAAGALVMRLLTK